MLCQVILRNRLLQIHTPGYIRSHSVTALGLLSNYRSNRVDTYQSKRLFSASPWYRAESSATSSISNSSETLEPEGEGKPYHGPLATTFRRLKTFSLAGLTLTTTMVPFIFIVESNLPATARLALASMAIGTSVFSTAVLGWSSKPYVTTLRRLTPTENGGAEGLEMTTFTWRLQERNTRIYDPTFLVATERPLAKWELAESIILSNSSGDETRSVSPGQEETVAETMDKAGKILGRWIVTWGNNGEGTCRHVGDIVRYFNVHEELLR